MFEIYNKLYFLLFYLLTYLLNKMINPQKNVWGKKTKRMNIMNIINF